MSGNTAEMMIRIDTEMTGAVNDLKKMEGQLNAIIPGGKAVSQVLQRIQFGLLQIVQGAARNAFVGLNSTISGMVSSGVNLAKTLESAAVGFDTLLESGEDVQELLLSIQTMAAKTPFDVDALTVGTQKLALITKNGAQAEQTMLDLGKAIVAAGRGNAELNRMAINLQQIGANSKVTARDLKEFGNAGIMIADLIAEYSDAFKETGKAATEAEDWLKSLKNPYEVLADVLHKAGTEGGRFADIYEKSSETIGQAIENMHDSMAIFSYRVLQQSTVLDKAKNIFTEFRDNLFLDDQFTANTAAAIKHIADMIKELDIVRPIIEGIKKAIAAFASGQFDNIIVFFRELFKEIKKFSGLQVITNAVKVFLDLFSDNHTADEVGNVARQIGIFIRYLLEMKFMLKVSSYLAGMINSVITFGRALVTVMPSIQSFGSGILSLIKGGGKWVLVAGAIVAALILLREYGSQIGEFFQDIGQFIADAGQAIANFVGEFVQVGFNLMAGLWNGIVDGLHAVIEKVKEAAKAILNAFKSMFGIHSPSTVMRDEIGFNIVAGIAEGIRKNYGTVVNAAQEVLDELVSLQDKYVRELSDFGALDLVETVKVYKEFAALYQKGSKSRMEMDDKVHDAQKAIIKEMISLIEDYNKKWDKAYQAAKDYYGLFDYTQQTLTRSTRSVIEGLQRQNDNLQKYYDNLKKMSQMGFDEDFMQYIYEQGLDAAAEVNGLAEATAEEIDKINELWRTRGALAADIASMNTQKLKEETLAELDYLQEGLDEKVLEYRDTGTYLTYNFTEGILDMMPTLQDAIARVEAKTKDSTNNVMAAVEPFTDYDWGSTGFADTGELTPSLEKLQLETFELGSAFDLLKNLLDGIPWYIYAGAIGLVVAKVIEFVAGLKKTGDTEKTFRGLTGAANSAASTMARVETILKQMTAAFQQSFINLIDALENLGDTLSENIEGSLYKAEVSTHRFENAYNDALHGMFAVTDEETRGVIETIGLAWESGKITTNEATKAITDIVRNGFGDVGESTLKTFDKIEKGLGVVINNSEHVVSEGLQTISYTFTDMVEKAVQESLDGTSSIATEALEKVGISVDELAKMVTNEAGEMTGDVQEAVTKMASELGMTWDEISTDGINAFKELEDEVGQDFEAMVADTQSASAQMETEIKAIAEKTGASIEEVTDLVAGQFQAMAQEGDKTAREIAASHKEMYADITADVDDFNREMQRTWQDVADSANTSYAQMSRDFSISSDHILQMNDDLWASCGKGIRNYVTTAAKAHDDISKQVENAVEDYDAAIDLAQRYTIMTSKQIVKEWNNTAAGMGAAAMSGTRTVKETFQKVPNAVSSAMDKTAQAAKNGGDKLVGHLDSAMSKASKTVSTATTKIVDVTENSMSTMATKAKNGASRIGDAFTSIGGALSGVAPEISAGFTIAGSAIDKGVQTLENTNISKIGEMFDRLKSKISDHRASIKTSVVEVGEAAEEGTVESFTKVADQITAQGDTVTKPIQGIQNKVLQKIVTFASDLGQTLAGIVNSVIQMLESIVNQLVTSVLRILENAVTAIGNLLQTVVNIIMQLVQSIMGGIGQAIAALLQPLSDPQLLIGAGTLVAVSLAITLLAVACAQFASVSWGDILKAVVALTALTALAVVATAALAVIMGLIGGFSEVIIIGVLVVAAMGVALAALGAGLMVVALSIQMVGEAIGAALMAVVTAVYEASQLAAQINLGGFVVLLGVITLLGLGLTASLLTNLAGAISGLFAMMAAGEVLVIAMALAEASKYASAIDPVALEKVVLTAQILGATMMMGLVSNIIGAFSGAFSAAISGHVMIIAKNLAEACKDAQSITVSGVIKLQQAIDILAHINFGGFFSNMGKVGSSAMLVGVSESVKEIMKNVKEICETLREIEAVDDKRVELQVMRVGFIMTIIQSMFDGDFLKAIGQNWQSSQIEGVAESVNRIMDDIYDIVAKLKRIEKIDPDKDVVKQIQKVKQIVETIQQMFDGNFFKGLGQNWQSSNIKAVAENVDEMMDSVIGMVRDFKELAAEIPKDGDVQIMDYIVSVQSIVQRMSDFVSGSWLGGVTNSKTKKVDNLKEIAKDFEEIMSIVISLIHKVKEQNSLMDEGEFFGTYIVQVEGIVKRLAGIDFSQSEKDLSSVGKKAESLSKAASSFDTILGTIQEMIKKLKDFKEQKYTESDVTDAVANVEKIVWRLAEIQFSQSEDDLGSVATKASKLQEMASHFDTILGTVQSMMNKLKELRSEGYTADKVVDYIKEVENIVSTIAKVNIEGQEGDDNLEMLATKSGNVKTAAESFDAILKSVQGMVGSVAKFHDNGYNVGETNDRKDIAFLITEVEKIVRAIAAVEIGDNANNIEDLANKSSKLKEAANNLNEIIKSVTEMVDNLNKFYAAYGNSTVKQKVDEINKNIIKPIIGDGTDEYPGIDVETLNKMDDNMPTKLGVLDQAIQKFADISTHLQSVQDASAGILNVQTIVNFIKETMATLPDVLDQFKSDMELQGEAYAQAFIDGYGSKSGEIENIGHEMQGALWAAIESHMQDMWYQGEAFGNKLIDGLSSKITEFGNVGHELQGKLWQQIESHMQDEWYQGEALGKKVTDGIRSRLDDFKATGGEVQGSFWRGIEDKMQDEWYQGAALSQKVIDGIKSKDGTYYGLGQNITIGVANGINAEVWRINNAMGNISSAAISKLKSLLGIASPSKVMAEMGSFVSQGFAEGIEDNLREVKNAGEALAEAVMEGYEDTIEPINLTAFEARNVARAEGTVEGYTMGGARNTSIVQNNNIYNGMDMASALGDIAWAVSRS